jgi:DNA invertase Pin-like site-specific DNA recombinase
MIVDGYIRVSQVSGRSGESFISPSLQREQIERWVAGRGYALGEILEELDESGARGDRPLLEQAVTRVERGESGGIVVAKIDRFGRSLVNGLAAIERVTRAGGVFASVQDGLDLSTDTGRLMLRMMLSMGEWELDRIRTGWDAAGARAVARGVCPGPTPFGYRKRSDGRLTPDPATAYAVTELFRLRAGGRTIGELRDYLEGERTAPPRALGWEWSTVRGLLRNRTYLGEIHRRPHVRTGAHPPLTDEPTWLAAQRPVERLPMRDRARPSLLRGLLRCAGCSRLMTTANVIPGPGHAARYSCATPACACAVGATVTASSVEPYIEALFWQELPGLRRAPARRRVRQLEDELARKERDLVGYRDSAGVISTLGARRYEDGLRVRVRRVERAQLALARARRDCDTSGLPDPAALRTRWPSMTLGERRGVLQEVFDCVFVLARGPIARRLAVCVRGGRPEELPSTRSLRRSAARPLDLSRLPPSPTLGKRATRPWSERRLRAALDPFLSGRAEWPDFPEFQQAGLGLAYRQVEIWGGPARWAVEYGLRRWRPVRRPDGWSEQRVRLELADYLEGVAGWPTAKQFHADGRWELQRAVSRFGGPERWAAEFDRELRWRQRDRLPWTEYRVERALRELSAGSGVMPTRREMRASGRRGLADAVGPASERERWARRLGLALPPRTLQPPTRWNRRAIDAAVRGLFEGRRVYPTRAEFRTAGLDHVYEAIRRLPGGHAECARTHGMVRRHRGGQVAEPLR